jgi:glucose-6-phosphate 1-dehydrogenase
MINDKITKNEEVTFVIFGGTGDLTKRKLIPAIYSLRQENRLPKKFRIVSIGRRDKDSKVYREEMKKAVKDYARYDFDEKIWNDVANRIEYQKFDFISDNFGYVKLEEKLSEIEAEYNMIGNRLYYLAVSPDFFAKIIGKLGDFNNLGKTKAWNRVMVEKPFGSDLKSARLLNEEIIKVIPEEMIYRIDHYLGKEMFQNIFAVRFSNSIFEPLWNNTYIDNVQITSFETLGVGNRGGYYEKAGILKDMLQNHLLQIISMVAMEPPIDFSDESLRDEKVKLLRSIDEYSEKSIIDNVVRGQYDNGIINGKEVKSYRSEERVEKDSKIETFMALKMNINNFRWYGVPFYIRTGKRMKESATTIVVQFKKLPGINSYKSLGDVKPNLLTISIQPKEGVQLQINGKRPGNDFIIDSPKMEYCQNCMLENNSPEAYERLIISAMEGNKSFFTRWDEIEYSWKFVEKIESVFKKLEPNFPNYKSGTNGPKESIELLEKEGRIWW